jgi:mono/diheme cytochrome c family protein
MSFSRVAGLALAGLLFLWAPAEAQDAAKPAAAADPGRDLVGAKCFQCHTDAMFRDQRQDRRAWEATIYRMMGRGGLYTADERRQMADYLVAQFGPGVPAKQ